MSCFFRYNLTLASERYTRLGRVSLYKIYVLVSVRGGVEHPCPMLLLLCLTLPSKGYTTSLGGVSLCEVGVLVVGVEHDCLVFL